MTPYNETSCVYAPRKFTPKEWSEIKRAVVGSRFEYGYELHHELGKRYEYLATMSILPVAVHRPGGVHCGKYIHSLPTWVRDRNIAVWRELMGDRFEAFEISGAMG